MDPASTPLLSVFSSVEVYHRSSYEPWGYGLNPLSLNKEVIFPKTPLPEIKPDKYKELWDRFQKEVYLLISSGKVDSSFRFASLLALLKKYLIFVPSATPWEEDEEHRIYPDISLFDHLKTTAAIASCLNRLLPDHLDKLYRGRAQDKPVASLLRGDFSRIQEFIYRVARPEGETLHGVARRLRGRSFYLTLLNMAVADWLIRQFELTPANILLEGGGHFDLLIPSDQKSSERLESSLEQLDRWFVKQFEGELGLVTAKTEVFPNDFEDLSRVYGELEAKLGEGCWWL